MLREGHIGLSLTLAAPIAAVVGVLVNPLVALLVIVGTLVGGAIPDLDLDIPIFTHRGFTHTVWFSGLCVVGGVGFGLLVFTLLPTQYFNIPTQLGYTMAVVFGLSMGYGTITHLCGDVITPMGVRPFHPVTPKNILPIAVSQRKYVFEIANADNKKLNVASSVVGMVFVAGSLYIIFSF